MSVDKHTLAALSAVLRDLKDGDVRPIPASIIEKLSGLSRPGRRLTIDLEASTELGAPLVTMVEPACHDDLLGPLTPRQRQVAALVIDGRSNREIAEDLGISLATVKDHVHAILVRMELPSRMALMAAAHGLAER